MVRAKEVLRAALKERNMDVTEFAARSGVSRNKFYITCNLRDSTTAKDFFRTLKELEIGSEYALKSTGEVLLRETGIVDVKELFSLIIAKEGISAREASRRCGFHDQRLTQAIMQRESITANELFSVLDVLDVSCTFFLNESGKRLRRYETHREIVTGNSDTIRFSTAVSKLLASSLYADGENEFGPDGKAIDLYIDKEGRYFIVEHNADPAIQKRIRTVPFHVAKAIIDMYEIPDDPV